MILKHIQRSIQKKIIILKIHTKVLKNCIERIILWMNQIYYFYANFFLNQHTISKGDSIQCEFKTLLKLWQGYFGYIAC
jgi:hypothetical protein